MGGCYRRDSTHTPTKRAWPSLPIQPAFRRPTGSVVCATRQGVAALPALHPHWLSSQPRASLPFFFLSFLLSRKVVVLFFFPFFIISLCKIKKKENFFSFFKKRKFILYTSVVVVYVECAYKKKKKERRKTGNKSIGDSRRALGPEPAPRWRAVYVQSA